MSIQTALHLMRFDKPVGILLLWWPTAWALWLAYQGMPPVLILGYFFLGTVLMRAAGCIANDLADRQIDQHVQRTKHRPLTSGRMRVREAVFWLGCLLFLALCVLLQLPSACFYEALIALFLAMTYPFAKRFLPTPQAVLALAFSMSIPMAYTAAGRPMDTSMLLIWLITLLWVVAYDTIYAYVDRQDDEKIGVHSTARYWGERVRGVVWGLQLAVHFLWLGVGYQVGLSWWFGLMWLFAGMNLARQWQLMRTASTEHWFQAFQLNQWYGGLLWLGLV